MKFCILLLFGILHSAFLILNCPAQTPSNRVFAVDLSVMVNSNGTLVAPTNFFSVNAALITDPNALHAASNFADLNNAATARANLGLSSAATNSANAFQPANASLTNWSALATNQATLTNDSRPILLTNLANAFAGTFTGNGGAITNVTDAAALHVSSNLSDLASAAAARTNLGLGTAATNLASAFQPASANLTNWSLLATNQATLTNDSRPLSLTNTANAFAGSFSGSLTGTSASVISVTAQSVTASNAGAGYVAALDAAHNVTNSAVLSANLPDLTANNNFTGTNTFATNNTTQGNFGSLIITNGITGAQRILYALGQSLTASSSGTLVYLFGTGTTTLSTIGSGGATTETPLINGTTIFLLPTNVYLGRSTPLGSGTNLYFFPLTNGVATGQQFYVWKGDGATSSLYATLVSNGPLTGVTNLGWAISNNSSVSITGNYPQVPFVQISTQ